jgi:hypothetical protein
MNYTPFNAELNADSESSLSIPRTYLRREKIQEKNQSNLRDPKSHESSTTKKYVRGMHYTPFDAELNADSESAYSIPQAYLRREKIQEKNQLNLRDPKSHESSTTKKYVRGMNYTPFDAELNADSESSHSIPGHT